MSDIPENDALNSSENTAEDNTESYKDEFFEFETVFGDPSEHRAKNPSGRKKRITAIVSACLAVAVLLGGTIAVIKLIPEKESETTSSSSDAEITLLELDENDINAVTVKNTNGSFRLIAEHTSETSEDSDTSSEQETISTEWSAEGVDPELTSSSSISSAVSAILNISAFQKIEGRTSSDCGLDSPAYSAIIETSDISYTVSAGQKSYDGLGYYTTVSGTDGIYLVDTSVFTGLDFTLLDFADTSAIAGVDASLLASEYVTESDGTKTLSSFDSITLTGKNFPKPLVIVPNGDDTLSSYLPYMISSPETRIADNVTDIYNLFESGLSVSGAYSYDITPSTLKKLGLDNPYLTVTFKAGSITKTFKFSAVQSDGCYAVISDDSKMVKLVDASSVSFIDGTAESFYGTQIYMRSINELSNMTFSGNGFSYSFDIVYDGSEDADEEYIITLNGTKLTAEYFQNFYEDFVGLTAADFETAQSSDTATLSITMTYSADGSKRTIDFYPSSATKTVYKVNGKAMGRLSTNELSRFIKKIEQVAAGEAIS